jgi:hypothetical protein
MLTSIGESFEQEPPMPSVFATIKVKEDKIEEAKQFLKDLSA